MLPRKRHKGVVLAIDRSISDRLTACLKSPDKSTAILSDLIVEAQGEEKCPRARPSMNQRVHG